MWGSGVLGEEENHQILSHHRKFAAKEYHLGLNGTYVMGISLFIQFVFTCRCYHLLRPFTGSIGL